MSSSPRIRGFGLASLLGLLAVLAPLGRLSGQDPYIRITEPSEWRDGKTLTVRPGRVLKITGVAWHPAGVKQVLVNNVAASTELQASLTYFERTLTVDPQTRAVTVVVVPENNQRFQASYQVALESQVAVRPPVVTRQNGFKKRGWIYAAGAVAGGVLTVMTTSSTAEICESQNGLQDCFDRTTTKPAYAPIGIGVLGVSVAAGLIDFVRSSRASGRVAAAPRDDNGARPSIDVSASSAGDGRVNLSLVRVRF